MNPLDCLTGLLSELLKTTLRSRRLAKTWIPLQAVDRDDDLRAALSIHQLGPRFVATHASLHGTGGQSSKVSS